MSNSFYNHSTYPTPNAPGSSANMRAELDLITAGFNKLPTLSGNGYKVAMINAAGTALVASSALQQLALTQSTIDSTPIGGTTRAAGAFTTLSANGAVNLGSAVTIAGGVIDNTVIGGTTPAAGDFTTLAASSITGNLTGNVTGNLTGDVTGNVTGNLTGNVTAGSGTSSFNNVTINGTLDMNAGTVGTITGLATPTNSSDAAPKGYVDTQVATRLALAGGTMSGAIAMGTNRITGLGDPSSTQDAATKNYTDTQDALKLSLTGGTMSGNLAMGTNRITGVGDPVGNQDAATKAYVDSVAQGLDVKASVRAATTDNINLSGTATIDGVALSAGDRVLVKNQTTASQNGIYVVSAGGWGRAPDMDAWAELPGAFVFVEDGSVNDNSGWVCTVAPGGTIGTTAVTFEQFSGAGQITAGAGMTKSGNTLNVGTASTARIVVNADNIDLATSGVTAGTYRSVTVDSYGRATGGTNPTTLAGYGITDAYTTAQVDSALALKLNLSGGTMSGNIAMGNNRITGLPTPSASGEAATKGYADDGLALKLNLSGGTMSGAIAMGGNKITGLGDPTSNQDAVTLNYVTTLYGSTASAAASASAAATSATNAATSATNAANSATAAASSATSAANSLATFRGQYLGAQASNPTLDLNGNALVAGDLYFNSSVGEMRVYNGSAWVSAYLPGATYVLKSGDTMTGALNGTTLNMSNGIQSGATGVAGVFTLARSSDGAGTAVLESLAGTNNIGLRNTAGSLIFSANNAEGMRLTSTGLGIGTSSPSTRLDVVGSATVSGSVFSTAFINTSNGTSYFTDASTGNGLYVGGSTASPANTVRLFTNAAERMRLDSSGNLGLGVTPSAWGSARRSFQVGTTGAVEGGSSAELVGLVSNAYLNSANSAYLYTTTNFASRYLQISGQHIWQTAGSGTAGNAITFTQAMTLDASGNLLLGATSGSSRLVVGGSSGQVATPTAIEMDQTYRQSPPAFDKLKFYLFRGATESYGFGLGASADVQYWAGSSSTGIHAWYTSQTERARIDSSGNVGIGTTSPQAKLVASNAGAAGLEFFTNYPGGGTGTYIQSYNRSGAAYVDTAYDAASHSFRTNATERARIDSSGNLLVGTTSQLINNARLSASGFYNSDSNTTTYSTQRAAAAFRQDGGSSSNNQGSYCSLVLSVNTGLSNNPGVLMRGYGGNGGDTYNIQINQNGNITNTNNSYGSLSDASIKENIVDATPKLNDLMAVQVRSYNLKDDEKKTKQLGVIAQELETVFPAMVETEADGFKSVKYSVFVPMLIKAMQEQQAIIESLKARLDAANL